MAMHELVEIEIREHVAVKHEEGLVELLAHERQRPHRSKRLKLLRVGDPHVPLITIAANAANEVAQVSGRDEDVSNSISSKPFQHEFEHGPRSDRHKRLWQY